MYGKMNNKRLLVILLIKAKCFKKGRTQKGQTAARIEAGKPERELEKGRGKQGMKEDIVWKNKRRDLKEVRKEMMMDGGDEIKRRNGEGKSLNFYNKKEIKGEMLCPNFILLTDTMNTSRILNCVNVNDSVNKRINKSML